MNVALLIIATNKYTIFLSNLLLSAEKYFLKNHNVKYNIFTDKNILNTFAKTNYFKRINIFHIEHKPFPYTTLYRYHFFKRHKNDIYKFDNYVYIDADCLFTSEITDEILGERIPVQHCGFVNARGTYETNPKSTSYVNINEGIHYFGGGFWSFSNSEFWKFIDEAVKMIDKDAKNEIIPIWHDESVLNRYLIDNPPTKILTPSYHYPENHVNIHNSWKSQNLHYDCKVLLLDKNHKEMRK